jgi:hypothetical protein
MIFSSLPLDVIHHILSYSDAIKWRNGCGIHAYSEGRPRRPSEYGKYMDKIPNTDIRYSMLTTIPKLL